MYLIESTNGWTETVDRKAANAALAKYLEPLVVGEVLHEFQTAIYLEGEAATWEDVVGFLGKITNCSAKLVPDTVAIAFWAQFTMMEDAGEN